MITTYTFSKDTNAPANLRGIYVITHTATGRRLENFAAKPEMLLALQTRLAERNRSAVSRAASSLRLIMNPELRKKMKDGRELTLKDPVKAAARRIQLSKSWADSGQAELQRIRMRERMADPARRAAMSKPVICIDTGVIYPSRNAAAASRGLHPNGLGAHLNGRSKSFAGEVWAWAPKLESQPTV